MLAAVVDRFESIAYDTVVKLGGRVVKMIGDEVMFVVDDVRPAVEIALTLAEAYSRGRGALRGAGRAWPAGRPSNGRPTTTARR